MVFPKDSFLISGTSFHGENCGKVTYDSTIRMEFEPENKYDPGAIRIMCDGNPLGYVPNEPSVKARCGKRIDDLLKVVNLKKVGGNCGIRVSFEEGALC